MSANDNDALALSVSRTARRLSISRSRLYELMHTDEAPRSFLLGRRRLFPMNEIRAWLAERVDAEHVDKANAQDAAN